MSFINTVRKDGFITKEELRIFLILLNPLAPHITSEMYEIVFGGNIIDDTWPKYDESKLQEDTYEMVVQVNGKVRGKITVSTDSTDDEMKKLAKEIDNVKVHIEGKEIVKEIVVPKKLVNIVVK